MLVAGLITLAYYTLGLDFIRQYQDGRNLFAVHIRNPLASVIDVLSQPQKLFVLLASKLFFAPGIFSILLVFKFVTREYKKLLLGLLSILLVQMLAIFALDGSHAFIHYYYYIACSPVLAMLIFAMGKAVLDSPSRWKNSILKIMLLLATVKYFDQLQFELRTMVPHFRERYIQVQDCQTLKHRHPEVPWSQGYVFRSSNQLFPEAGICFFEREGSPTSKFGLFASKEELPNTCHRLDGEGTAVLATCE
jgi:hypothetical protein